MTLVGRLFPYNVAVTEVSGHMHDAVYLEELEAVSRSTEKRKAEFLAGRSCARKALGLLVACCNSL